ncbi:aldo/keto reductase [Lacisediminihabitans profunda]|uniref:Aldo/keto reductase n=1 Tax=Lacisediminihabitans profunda TaxID=2594790 RepID=A0A5C8UPN5_9MICO|nr:aldo/keto reductase [Lacisediminihabitans profunda]TXN29841.1 aldo/keto reductase [Lacisediminihabitans profunda]
MADTAIRSVTLGSTGIAVTEFFFGGAAIGGIGSAPSRIGLGMATDEALERLDEAYEVGIRVLDTANSFAGGESERVIGRWREERERDDVLVSTKVGNVVERGQETISLSADHIARQLALSRSRLGTVDLYVTHGVDPSTPLEETITAFAAAIDTEQIRAYGCSNLSVRQVEAWLLAADRAGLPRPGWMQNGLSLLSRGVERDLLPLLAEEGLGFVAYSPLAGGILSNRFLGADLETLPEPAAGSRLALAPAMYGDAFTLPNLAAVAALEPLAREREVSIAGLALGWLRRHPLVTATIVSPRRTAQWDAVTEAAALDFDDALAEQVGALFA